VEGDKGEMTFLNRRNHGEALASTDLKFYTNSRERRLKETGRSREVILDLKDEPFDSYSQQEAKETNEISGW